MKGLITKNGYGLYLNSLTPECISGIQKELTVKPKVLSDYDTGSDLSFPVYKMSENRIYMPKYYGIKKYGPLKNKIKDGVDSNLEFNGTLKDHQTNFCNSLLNEINTHGSCIGTSQTGSGKCMGFNTPILMYDGSIKMIQSIEIGDALMGDDNTARIVHSLGTGRNIMYEIETEYSEKFTVNAEHILCLKTKDSDTVYEMSVDYYLNKCEPNFKEQLLLYRCAINYAHKPIPMDPYVYGKTIIGKISDEYIINSMCIRNRLLSGLLKVRKETDPDVIRIKKTLGYFTNIKFTTTEKGIDNYYGFEIDGNGRYLLDNHIVTHNTAMALWIASKIKKRTLIIVHKQFLLDQWKERIEQFLPDSSIGIIRRDTFDINKDIVIGMLQTILSRDYPKGSFDSFHFTIYDEMHHLGAQHFSKVFYKILTKFNLGLSATPVRQDGLIKVTEWFLGKIIVNEVLSEIEKPIVKFINCEYSSKITPKFNFKGTLNSQNLINQLVTDELRNTMIVNEIIIQARSNRKILVLSGRRNHCINLETMVLASDPDITTGLYLGQMVNDSLKESNTKTVIFGTYSMVAEAYDNPDLDTLIMATGMGSVEQAIGRIIRKKNKNKPLVIDFTDVEYFSSQKTRRLTFYKKHKYILDNDSDTNPYNPDSDTCPFV